MLQALDLTQMTMLFFEQLITLRAKQFQRLRCLPAFHAKPFVLFTELLSRRVWIIHDHVILYAFGASGLPEIL